MLILHGYLRGGQQLPFLIDELNWIRLNQSNSIMQVIIITICVTDIYYRNPLVQNSCDFFSRRYHMGILKILK